MMTDKWKTPVAVMFNDKCFFSGSDALKAYQITGIISGVLVELGQSGTVKVLDGSETVVFKEFWKNGVLVEEYHRI
jgi:hypothetical protein